MTRARAHRSRRSCLAVPGSSERMLAKAPTLAADQVILDLEDAVAPGAKQAARKQVVRALTEQNWGPRTRAVRVNDCATGWTLDDLTEVIGGAGAYLDCIVLPKVEDAGQVAFVDHVLRQLELGNGWDVGRIGLELQVESARGLVGAESILGASARTEAFVLGPGDLAASLGMPGTTVGSADPDHPGDEWHWPLFTVLVQARHAGVQAIDGPYARIRDLEGFRQSARRSRLLGYDGKWVLHPDQIDAANEIFGLTLAEHERAVDILDAYRWHVETQARGAIVFGDEMVDEATRKMALVNVEKGRQQGLEARKTPHDVDFAERAAWRAEHLD